MPRSSRNHPHGATPKEALPADRLHLYHLVQPCQTGGALMRVMNLVDRSCVLATMLAGIGVAAPVSVARAAELPPEALGTWAWNCELADSPRVSISPGSVVVTIGGKRHRYGGVDVSWSWEGGAKADGSSAAVLVSKRPNGPFAFVFMVPVKSDEPFAMMESGHPDHGKAVRSLLNKAFVKC